MFCWGQGSRLIGFFQSYQVLLFREVKSFATAVSLSRFYGHYGRSQEASKAVRKRSRRNAHRAPLRASLGIGSPTSNVARYSPPAAAARVRSCVSVLCCEGCRQWGVRCWGGRTGGRGAVQAGLAVLESAGVRCCATAGVAIGGVDAGGRRGGRVRGAWKVRGILGASRRLRRR